MFICNDLTEASERRMRSSRTKGKGRRSVKSKRTSAIQGASGCSISSDCCVSSASPPVFGRLNVENLLTHITYFSPYQPNESMLLIPLSIEIREPCRGHCEIAQGGREVVRAVFRFLDPNYLTEQCHIICWKYLHQNRMLFTFLFDVVGPFPPNTWAPGCCSDCRDLPIKTVRLFCFCFFFSSPVTTT